MAAKTTNNTTLIIIIFIVFIGLIIGLFLYTNRKQNEATTSAQANNKSGLVSALELINNLSSLWGSDEATDEATDETTE